MLRTGAIFLSIWSGLNLLLALGIVIAILLLNENAPALYMLFSKPEIQLIESRALATINSLAVFLNTGIAAYCALSLVVIWANLMKNEIWAFRGLLASSIFIQIGGYVSDSFLGGNNFIAITVGVVILSVGFGLSGYAIFNQRRALNKEAA